MTTHKMEAIRRVNAMCSALVMILAAGMILGDEPGKALVAVEQRLDLRGEWEGTWEDAVGQKWDARISEGKLEGRRGGVLVNSVKLQWKVVDEGNSRIKVFHGSRSACLGIYRKKDGRVTICYGLVDEERPTEFKGGNGQNLLILRRVKRAK